MVKKPSQATELLLTVLPILHDTYFASALVVVVFVYEV
ncbi:unnamed protein product, partial [Callosobruchus maculatus]